MDFGGVSSSFEDVKRGNKQKLDLGKAFDVLLMEAFIADLLERRDAYRLYSSEVKSCIYAVEAHFETLERHYLTAA